MHGSRARRIFPDEEGTERRAPRPRSGSRRRPQNLPR